MKVRSKPSQHVFLVIDLKSMDNTMNYKKKELVHVAYLDFKVHQLSA